MHRSMQTYSATSDPSAHQVTENPTVNSRGELEGSLPQNTDVKRPPRMGVLGLLAAVWLLVAIPIVTDTGIPGFTALFLLAIGFLLGFIWLGVFCSNPLPRTRAGIFWTLSLPCAGILSVLLTVGDVGLRVRLALCRPSLERYVTTLPPGTNAFSLHQGVGLFWVGSVEGHQGSVLLYTSGSGLMNSTGLAYYPPNSRLPPVTIKRLTHLSGNWYLFEEKF